MKRGGQMQLPYSETLDIQYMGQLFQNTSECYKFFWFQAILTKIEDRKTKFTFEELVDEMIADAWYMVAEYHLNLGPNDKLEAAVNYMYKTANLKSAEKKSRIIEYLVNCEDKEVLRFKKILIKNVPYRIQSPFMPEFKNKDYDIRLEERLTKINQQQRLIYYFDKVDGVFYHGLDTVIVLQQDWERYLYENLEIIRGWLRFHMIQYLQRRNPSVPGIAYKLYPPKERDLERVKKYWKMIVGLQPIREIYGHNPLRDNKISIDHFVPWSYVAHDEFWNLHPTTVNINSKKGNHLPEWETYFQPLSELEYLSYQMMWQYDSIHREFEKCAETHINNSDISERLYRQGLSAKEFQKQLSEILHPVYQAAQNCGFREWVYCDNETC